jgi:hypothetical protein
MRTVVLPTSFVYFANATGGVVAFNTQVACMRSVYTGVLQCVAEAARPRGLQEAVRPMVMCSAR